MKSKHFLTFTTLVICFWSTSSLPVKEATTTKDPNAHQPDEYQQHNLENVIEYERYLKEVVSLLESDTEFRKKLDSANETDIRSGKIAHELELVDHNVRTKLDELKRSELERLRGLAMQMYEKTNEIDREHMKIPEHIDHENPHTFEIEDLKKLIVKTGEDLAEADRRRREDFKEYELQKEFEKQEKLRHMDEEHRKKYEEEIKAMTEKHNKHEKVHHPGSKDQLEEVWEKQDHMDPEDFNPKKFFMMHDIDGNGFWDENEVKALFKTELDKVYQSGLPEDDMRERVEEMERMREHVFTEADTNRDHLISFQEFIDQTKRREFQQDPGWDTVDQQPQFTNEEYAEFERRRLEEVGRMIAEGKLPDLPMPHVYDPETGQYYQASHPDTHSGQNNPHAILQQNPNAANLNAVPQHHQNAVPQHHPNAQPPPLHPNSHYNAAPQHAQQQNQHAQQQNQHAQQQNQHAQQQQAQHQQQMHQQYADQQHQQAKHNQQMGQEIHKKSNEHHAPAGSKYSSENEINSHQKSNEIPQKH